MKKKIIIIGAGMSGLCAGNYLQMNGYDTEIFELHDRPGGLCTSWKRKGYTFDGCIHWLVGSSPADPFHALWNELIDMRGFEFVDHDRQSRFVARDGRTLDLYCNPDRLEKELLEKAPEDAPFIRMLVKAVRKFRGFELPLEKPPQLMGVLDKIKMLLKMLPYVRFLMKYSKVSVAELGGRCRTPVLREALTHCDLYRNFSFIGFILTLAWFGKKSAGYPVGGSLAFARRFEERYIERGGRVRYRSRVRRIVVENDRATGVELENGATHSADIVISASDGHSTIFEMLEGRYTNRMIEDMYGGRHELLSPFPSLLYVSMGLDRTFGDLPHQIIYSLEEPVELDDETKAPAMIATFYGFDPSLAPAGKTVVIAMFECFNHSYWSQLREKDVEKYKAEKKRVTDLVIDLLEDKIGDFKKRVEVVDLATPATFKRYTNNWKGSYEGWLPAPGALTLTIDKELPGLKDFYLIGQWVEPGGGLPAAILSGRGVAQILCKRDGKAFRSKL